MQLGIGTAQFGSAYGITNRRGQVSEVEIRDILAAAEESGIRVIDTAAVYGDAENVLGSALHQGHTFRIITKTQPVDSEAISKQDVSRVRDSFMRSLDRLGLSCAAGLLVHHANELLRPGGELLADLLGELKRAGLVERIGVSTYSPAELRRAARVLRPDLVQVPVNILDQRFLTDGILEELRHTGTEIHARSVFLQGLLLSPCRDLPPFTAAHGHAFEKLEAFASGSGLTRLELALGFLAACRQVDIAIVGVTGVGELEEIIRAGAVNRVTPHSCDDLAYDDESLLNPSLWRNSNLNRTAK